MAAMRPGLPSEEKEERKEDEALTQAQTQFFFFLKTGNQPITPQHARQRHGLRERGKDPAEH
jgi:hypothetical protein